MAIYKSICWCVSEPIKNIGNIRGYFIENTASFTTFHFFHGYSNKPSYVEKYRNGTLLFRRTFPTFGITNKNIKIILHYIYINIVFFVYADKKSFVIIDNPFFLFLHSIPAFLKKQTFIFLIGDYFPEHTGLMGIYNKMADFYHAHLSHVIYLSPPIQKIYSSKIADEKSATGMRSQISVGIVRRSTDTKEKQSDSRKTTLGFIGVIRSGHGLELVLNHLKTTSDHRVLEIIGEGYDLNYYKNMAHEFGLQDRVVFHGFVDDPEHIIRTWDVGLALYENRADNLSMYCEPTKIKEYLSYGLPVITTKATYFHSELQTYGAGEVVDETTEDLERALAVIEEAYEQYTHGVGRLVDVYSYKDWYDKRFTFLR